MSASAGRVLIIPRGAYNNTIEYHTLDAVLYNGSMYIARQTTIGNTPVDGDYWMLSAVGTSDLMPGSFYGSCATAGNVAAKVVTVTSSENFTLKEGDSIAIKFDNTNTASNPTINVNDTGAKPVVYDSNTITTENLGYAGTASRIIHYIYNGTSWVFIGWGSVAADATSIDYDNSLSGLTADNVQGALDELSAKEVTMDTAPTSGSTNPVTSDALFDYFDIRPAVIDRGVVALVDRWLRFDPTNTKGLVIKAGTHILKADGTIQHYLTDTTIDLSSYISGVGTDYFVYLANDGTITAGTTQPSDTVKIGRFHTLCVSAGTMTMVLPASGLSAGSSIMVKSYTDDDPDFKAFYNKTISAVSGEVATVPHPLSGFVAGDILPESVFCLTFHPDTLVEDAMVYDKDTDRVIDVYLQSGKGVNTRSQYNATHTVSRTLMSHQIDMQQVGKQLLSDHEFSSAALGSNEKTNITGSSDKTTVGGHVDTSNRRMISAIGCEEMCGYLWQWLNEIAPTGGSGWVSYGDTDDYGQSYGMPYVLLAGGTWHNSSNCGSRSRAAHAVRSIVDAINGGRGSSRVCRRR